MRCLARPTLWPFLVVAPLLALGVGCGPSYPSCKKDEDCNKDKPRHEYCVNQSCQQCRKDADCATGKACNKGRCDAIPNYCDSDAVCGTGKSCLDHRCKACSADGQCGAGGKCKSTGKCLRKGSCDTDDDCAQDEDCKAGVCTGGKKPVGPVSASCTLAPIYFDYNEFVLTTEATDLIDKNGSCIKTVGRSVQIIGRTDPRGTEEYNLALSEKRAQQIKDRLERMGLEGGKLHTLPKGELEATGKDEAGWAQDRRVDFEWM